MKSLFGEINIPRGAWPIMLTPFNRDGVLDTGLIPELLKFYTAHGTPGILVLGQAGEVLALTDEERHAVLQAAGRSGIQLILAGVANFGAGLHEQADSLRRVGEAGIHLPVVALSLLPAGEDLAGELLRIAEIVPPEISLGIYEMPDPQHRLLTPAEVERVARSGRYAFMKDTCRKAGVFAEKVLAASGSPLKLFQANLKILPESLEAGAHGFCGWMPIVAPELCAQLCDHTAVPQSLRAAAYLKLMAFQAFLKAQGFPASGKFVLQRRGVAINSACRIIFGQSAFTAANETAIEAFLAGDDWFSPMVEEDAEDGD